MQNTSQRPTGNQPAPAAALTGLVITPREPVKLPDATAPAEVLPPSLIPDTLIPTNDDTPALPVERPPSPRAFPSRVRPAPSVPVTAQPVGFQNDERVAPGAVIDLWEHLAANRLRPMLSDLDALVVARQWPNSLLLRATDDSRGSTLEVAHMFAPTAGGPTVAIPIDAMTVDWIVALGREVVSTGSPVHETDAVPTARGAINCGVIALPFGPRNKVDHVLCHLYRVDDGVLEGDTDDPTRIPTRDRRGIRRLFAR
jgi:hypothetical protein